MSSDVSSAAGDSPSNHERIAQNISKMKVDYKKSLVDKARLYQMKPMKNFATALPVA